MALQKTKYIEGTTYPLDYHRITEVRYRAKRNMLVMLESYPDELARRDGNPPAETRRVNVPLIERTEEEQVQKTTDPETGEVTEQTTTVTTERMLEDSVDPGNVLENAYRLLKLTEDFMDAKDV